MGVRCTIRQWRGSVIIKSSVVLLALNAIVVVCFWRYTFNRQTLVENYADVRDIEANIDGPYKMDEHFFLEPELNQFYHYSRQNMSIKINFMPTQNMRIVDSSKYRHTVSLLLGAAQRDGIFLRVVERFKGTATTGGSCLYGVSNCGGSNTVCSSRDFYNGSYVVFCPRATDATCCNVTLYLQCVNFSAFTSLYGPLRDIIWTRHVCDVATEKVTVPGVRDWPLFHAARMNVVTWHYSDNDRKWRVRTSDGHWFRSLNKATLCACLKSFGDVYMFGSSHMRFKFDYLMEECYERPAQLSQKHFSTSVGNVHYQWCTFADHFERVLSSNVTFKKNDLVLHQIGAHDLATRGVAATMAIAIRRFVETLAAFAEMSKRRGFKLVLLTSPPCPDANDNVPTKGGRNNFAVAAFNQMLRIKAADLGVDVFDEFSIILPRQNANTCGSHYICYNRHFHKITGSVGITVTQLMLSRLCNLI